MALPKAITNALNKRVYPSTMSHVDVLRCKYDGRIPDAEMAEAERLDAEDAVDPNDELGDYLRDQQMDREMEK